MSHGGFCPSKGHATSSTGHLKVRGKEANEQGCANEQDRVAAEVDVMIRLLLARGSDVQRKEKSEQDCEAAEARAKGQKDGCYSCISLIRERFQKVLRSRPTSISKLVYVDEVVVRKGPSVSLIAFYAVL